MKNLCKLTLSSLILMVSCSKENELLTQTQKSTKFYASIEASDTRTYVENSRKVLWSENDEITLFKGNLNAQQYRYIGQAGLSSGEFEEVTSSSNETTDNTLTANYAIYPHDENTTITDAGVINYNIPAIQQYAENSFGLGANVMVAATNNLDDNFLAFKNLCGYFEFSLYGDATVKSIELKGNNGEKLAGTVTISTTYGSDPTILFTNGATETLTLNCGEGVKLSEDENNPTKFWIVVPANEYTKGITITITNVDGSSMEKTTSNSIPISRSSVQPLKALKVIPTTPPHNQIWYTTNNDKPITLNFTNIVEHSYDDGKGIISFEDNITSIKYGAFQFCTTLTSITIPDCVESIGMEAFAGCTNLASVNIPYGITDIRRSTFYDCRSLTDIDIPNSVISIGDWAFWRCTSLINIYIPENVESIGVEAFADCSSLKGIYCKPTTPPIKGKDMFYNNSSDRKIYVPTDSFNTYIINWSTYADDIVGHTF